MQSLVQRLIAEELRVGNDSEAGHLAAFRVCEKLRVPLSALAGIAGFRSLLSRALVLARAEAPLLNGIQIKPDGTLEYPAELASQPATEEAAAAGTALAAQLLGLLIIFIGEALTLRIAHDVWPKAALKDPEPKGNQS
jgi:hypothetical protein